jgi:hypothetical protein
VVRPIHVMPQNAHCSFLSIVSDTGEINMTDFQFLLAELEQIRERMSKVY